MWPFQVPGVSAASPPVEVANSAHAQMVAILWPSLRATMSEIARRDFHCDLQIDDFAADWGAGQLGALVDTARHFYVECARSQSWARRRVALLALARVERQALARPSKRLRGKQRPSSTRASAADPSPCIQGLAWILLGLGGCQNKIVWLIFRFI